MTATRQKPPLKLCGTPRRIELVSPLELTDRHIELTSDELPGYKAGSQLRCRVKRFSAGHPANLRLKLPKDTPPGTYRAQLKVNGEFREVEIEVQPKVNIKHFPTSLTLSGAMGDKIEQNIVFENLGNMPVTLPDEAIGNLFKSTGIPEAFANTLQMPTDDPKALMDNLLIKLHQGYGGVMKFKFRAESMTLLPNERRTFAMTTRLPKSLANGERYFGWLHVNDFHLLMQVTVAA